MSGPLFLVVGDGEYDVGKGGELVAGEDPLPALPRLVHRLLGEPRGARYLTCARKQVTTRQQGGKGPDLSRKIRVAMLLARQRGAAGVAFVVDRDVEHGRRLQDLERGRDGVQPENCVPSAIGMAVETFDAWMIADTDAMCVAAGADAAARPCAHPQPERLCGRPDQPDHPKQYAAQHLGGLRGLGDRYAAIAATVPLAHLERACPKGFRPFANEVRQHLRPVIGRT